jgi:hypothetical protein
VAACAICACSAVIDGDSNPPPATDAPKGDAPKPIDAAIDAPPPRPCTGGDANMPSSDGSCFLLFTTPKTYADATAACIANNTHLAVVNTLERYTVAKALAGTRDVFIGLSDEAAEGMFRWIDSTPLTFTKWDPTEPNNGNGTYQEDCAIIAGARAGDWDDRPCAPVSGVGGGAYAYMCHF